MGKTPHAAAVGIFVAMMTVAGCQSPAPTLGNPGTMTALNGTRPPQSWNSAAPTGGVANQTQSGMNTANNGQMASGGAANRQQSGQSFGNNNLQGNFANSGAQPAGFNSNQNNFANNQQSGSLNANPGSNGVQQTGYNPGPGNGSMQQAGSWSNNAQNGGFSAGNRNMARNLDAGQSMGSSSSPTPAPVFPNTSGFGDGPSSKDPPPVAKPTTEYSTKYGDLPFNGGRVSNQ